jgi:hypothetical protein
MQGLFNKKIIIADALQSHTVTGRSKTTPLQHGLYVSGTNSEIFTLIFSIASHFQVRLVYTKRTSKFAFWKVKLPERK